MKKLRNLVALFAIFSMAAVFTGCGDDDDDDDNGNPAPAGPQFAPATQAGFIGNTYTITLANGQTAQLTFPNANTYSFTSGGQTETGTITGIARQGETYVATLTPANNTGTIRNGEMRVTFNQRTATTYAGSITTQGANGPVTSQFTATVNQGGTTQGGTTQGGTTQGGTTQGGTTQGGTTQGGTTQGGTTQGGTTQGGTTQGGTTQGGTTQGGTTGGATEPPASLSGRSLQLTYGNGGGERFDFQSDSAGIYEPGQGNANEPFTYVWDRTNTRIQATRRNAQGQTAGNYDIDLTFNQGSGNAGTAVVIFTAPGQTPATDPATFTLTP